MDTATETHASRERRFKRFYLDDEQRRLDNDQIEDANALGIEVDGQMVRIELEGLGGAVLRRLVLDGLYDKLTRAVHSAKPKSPSTEAAIELINTTFAEFKSGKIRKTRTSSGPRAFDETRFITAIQAGAKALKKVINPDKLQRLVAELKAMDGKTRQKYIQSNYLGDPHFKLAWEAPIIEKKKQEIKKGERKSAFDSLFGDDGDEE